MVRIEKDTLGWVDVPEGAYYGPQTSRALRNFTASGLRLPSVFIRAQAMIKIAAARANIEAGKLDRDPGEAVIMAAEEILTGKFHDQFLVDIYQSGAGTSQNMNANEVIANRALEIKGLSRGRYDIIHPNDHVNMSQSSNDTIHTAIHIAATESIKCRLVPVLTQMHTGLLARSREFESIVKPGRTHLQDAVPITLGQEFSGFARMLELGTKRLISSLDGLAELNLGGTAVGTGLNVPPDFSKIAVHEINRLTGLGFRITENRFGATQSAEAILGTSAALRSLSVSLIKIANDLRLLCSGPRAGLGEINLPAVQPGSSIMPGKINPVMAEMLNMVCFQVIGNDTTIMLAAQAGQMELNVFTPVIAYNLLNSIEIMARAIGSFNHRCLEGITANTEHCSLQARSSLALVTALAPRMGYEKASEIAHYAYINNKTIKEVVLESGLLTEDEADELLDPLKMTEVIK